MPTLASLTASWALALLRSFRHVTPKAVTARAAPRDHQSKITRARDALLRARVFFDLGSHGAARDAAFFQIDAAVRLHDGHFFVD